MDPRVIEHYGGDVTRANVHPRCRAAVARRARDGRRVSVVDQTEPRPFAEASRALLRESILQAADRLLREASWGAVTMAQVAEGAGVSRQTVYNEFGNRADLARAYALWAADELLDDVERSVAAHRDDLRAALVSTFATLLAIGHEHPLIKALGDDEGSAELAAALVSGTRSPLVVVASDRLAEIIGRAWPDLPAAPVASTSEVLVRLAISHLLHPSSTPKTRPRRSPRFSAPSWPCSNADVGTALAVDCSGEDASRPSMSSGRHRGGRQAVRDDVQQDLAEVRRRKVPNSRPATTPAACRAAWPDDASQRLRSVGLEHSLADRRRGRASHRRPWGADRSPALVRHSADCSMS